MLPLNNFGLFSEKHFVKLKLWRAQMQLLTSKTVSFHFFSLLMGDFKIYVDNKMDNRENF